MSNRKYISIQELESGMIIEQAVIDRLDRVLVHRESVLDDFIIDHLKQLGLTGVYIRSDEGEEEEEEEQDSPALIEARISPVVREKMAKYREEDPAKVHLTEAVRQRVSTGIQHLYNNTEDERFTQTSNDITNDLQSAIEENDSLAVDLTQLKTNQVYTFRHSVDVATIAMIIGKTMGMNSTELHEIGIAGLLHDMGKSKVDPAILNKPSKLTEEEFEHMKQHPVLGYRILKDKQGFKDIISLAVLQHHEKMDGSGYPMGVTAEKICRYARILSVADVYDALVTNRPYKKSYSQRTAVDILMSMTGELDLEVMRTFLKCVILYPVDTIVKLSNGEYAKVVKNALTSALRPIVVGVESGRVYDLADDMRCANLVIE